MALDLIWRAATFLTAIQEPFIAPRSLQLDPRLPASLPHEQAHPPDCRSRLPAASMPRFRAICWGITKSAKQFTDCFPLFRAHCGSRL